MLIVVFAMSALFAIALTSRAIVPFTIGALGIAIFIGLGNGCVFKLVPQYFAADTAVVTGLVGAMGGLGGFFPPLVLGAVKGWTGSYAPGFLLLSMFCILCLILNYLYLVRTGSPTRRLVASP
jgi:NNP family nitrate/nitrite transporter-like MFS transporter